ncbi:TPA: phage tail protein, partial [Providencia alcalifaciens]
MAQLHGVETIELTSGTVSVTTIETAIIGIVGTAPEATGAIAASCTTGTPLLDNVLTFTANKPGRAGNTINVRAEVELAQLPAKGKGNRSETTTSAQWRENELLITLACDEFGVSTASVASVVDAVNALSTKTVVA